ncbi:MAG: glycosyltransferase family 4 protein, partial [Bacteroidales bacterium]|nr:glycosyltransferase family 4 protein [Bacteroidales bacterium]
MKILIIHTAYRFKGGEDSVVESEKKLLQENGHDVYSLIFENPANPVKALALFFIALFNPVSYFKVIKAINVFQPDVIHVHNWHFAASPSIFRAARGKKIPVIYTLHNFRLLCPSGILFHQGKLFLNSLQQSFPWGAVKKKVYRNSILQTFWLAFVVWFHHKTGTWNKVDKYIALTSFSKDLFLSSKFVDFAHKIIVKPNFTRADKLLNVKRQSDIFLFIGRLSEEKGIDCLLEAVKLTGLELKIGGNGPLIDSIKDISRKYSNIQYLGNLEKMQVQQFMQECTALIFSSIWYETFGLVVIEAFSQGLPVIASNIGAMSSMIKDGYNGLLFEAGNSADLQAKLIKWQNKSQEEKEQFSKNAYQTYLDNYTPEQNITQLMVIYDSV